MGFRTPAVDQPYSSIYYNHDLTVASHLSIVRYLPKCQEILYLQNFRVMFRIASKGLVASAFDLSLFSNPLNNNALLANLGITV